MSNMRKTKEEIKCGCETHKSVREMLEEGC